VGPQGPAGATGAAGTTTVSVSDAPPPAAVDNTLWWESDTGLLYVRYNDGNSTQWVIASPQPDTSTFVTTSQAVRYDVAQVLTAAQQTQARNNIAVQKKNYIINGAMMVSQQNGTTVLAVGGYVADQFLTSVSAGTSFSVANVASVTPAGSPNRLRVTATAAHASVAASDIAYIEQRIEGLRVADLRFGGAAAKTTTLQFGVKAPAGIYSCVLINGGANRCYVAEYVIAAGEANTDVVKSVTIPGDVTGTWATDNTFGLGVRWGLMVGATFQQAAGAWGTTNAVGSPNQFNLMGTNGNVFELFDVSLTEGNVAPPFIMPPFDQELLLCRRYFWRRTFLSNQIISTLQAYATNAANGPLFNFCPDMRAAPTATFSAAAHFSCQPSGGGGAAASALSIVTTADEAFFSTTSVAASLAAGAAAAFYANTAGAWMQFDARL
jgi:hypothetical protein